MKKPCHFRQGLWVVLMLSCNHSVTAIRLRPHGLCCAWDHRYLKSQISRAQQVYQGVQRELVNLAFEQVIQSRLRHSQASSSIFLRKIPALDSTGESPHELGTDTQVFGFFWRINQRIPDTGSAFVCHLFVTS
ncbi:hypothetical protein AW942_14325 [Pseudomonas aeruginosa]|nr:hypothetical protein BHE76_25330 [Pseudomonas aeruginosa]OFO93161.1 hypothetical protein HMPREF3014_11570 [Pseudomonas sp. HMSC065H01]OFR06306.1 hypothetical protein HMPREF2906_25330 [Pseudomonas sp. HMSC065H02]OHP27371.1 hypothetical protein HMPREF2535_04755 [Pseudomonas sp. HMSC060F12]KXC74845.1 hypothetical protein AW897_14750 [Pseudomonas aeruginosa]